MSGLVTVIGIDPTWGTAPAPPAAEALTRARLVVGAARHLHRTGFTGATDESVGPTGESGGTGGAETVVLGPLEPALDRVRSAVAAGDPVVVLASGDPGFFGVVRRLRAEGLPLRVLPAVSSVAAAFARAGLPWDGAAVVSAHGRELRPALNACRALPAVAVLTAPGAGAAELGAGLAGWDRRLVVAEHLGEPGERCTELSPAEAAARTWADPHIVLVLRAAPEPRADGDLAAGRPAGDVLAAGPCADGLLAPGPRGDNQPAAAPPGGWALPDGAFEHRDGMVTKAEVRALAVARLRPRLGRLIWDVGAGSGSVGIECGLLGAAVVAVEADPAGCAQIARNATAHGVDVRVVPGRAPQVLAGLPEPDAVFVGGGGPDVVAAVAARSANRGPQRIVVALASVDRVRPCVDALRGNGFAVEGGQLTTSRLADLPGGSLRLSGGNPVFWLTGER